ncbi:MAG: leucine-rich repeat domain-containing protein, partial [Ureaplasma sp.]|nr:leucine-rich repeat domain-containing protein [Ureaplasma sp.]
IKEANLKNKSDIYTINDFIKMKDKNLDKIVVNENSIQINNLELTPSTEYFNWDETKTKIIGLTENGKKQTSIILPEQTQAIEKNIFSNNTAIESIDMSLTTLKDTPGSILSGLFSGCTNLKTVVLPWTLEILGSNVFNGCTKLTTVKYSDVDKTIDEAKQIPSLKKISGSAFKNCTSLSSFIIPDTVIEIGESAFYGAGLLEIKVPKKVETLGSYAFYNCASLTNVTLPNKLKRIEDYTFANCKNLINVNIPSSIEYIGASAFPYSPNVTLKVPSEEIKEKLNQFNINKNIKIEVDITLATNPELNDSLSSEGNTLGDSSNNTPSNK